METQVMTSLKTKHYSNYDIPSSDAMHILFIIMETGCDFTLHYVGIVIKEIRLLLNHKP
jgi:hypothetical protein